MQIGYCDTIILLMYSYVSSTLSLSVKVELLLTTSFTFGSLFCNTGTYFIN